ncbi:transcription elongation factor A protein-like 5 isoform X2 [Symphalangus syndactylus]|uniref:transcription elongation factor A protein-like 5 isoform X2 n=1 Tax=Symphalangus syndactylus TaxID=9590 RepID=UPI003004878C
MVMHIGYRGSDLLSRYRPVLPPFILAQKFFCVGQEVWVPAFISLEKCRLLAEGNVRKSHFPEMATNPSTACGSLWLGWQRAKTRAGPGLDSLHSFPDAHSFGARNGGLGAGRRGGRGAELERGQGLRIGYQSGTPRKRATGRCLMEEEEDRGREQRRNGLHVCGCEH